MKHLERKVRFWVLTTMTKKSDETNATLIMYMRDISSQQRQSVPVFRCGICYKRCAVCDKIYDPYNQWRLMAWCEAQHENAAVANQPATQ
jgi:hypothetical protein